jgi:chemotaxis protein methyltransferase CheR
MFTITQEEFTKLTALIRSKYGINLKTEKQALVIGRLQKVLFDLRLENFGDYYDYLVTDTSGKALSTLVDRITTNHTYFMREKEHFDYFTREVLPYIEKNSKNRDCRIWCAASSTGEEPYTLAILIKEYFQDNYRFWDTKLLATDISEEALMKAKKGEYSTERLAPVPKYWLHTYFNKLNQALDIWTVSNAIKNEVIYRRFNLMEVEFPFKRKFHAIFIRNVMIYFDNETKKILVDKLYDVMENGGYLFIGHSESIPRGTSKFTYIKPAVYRKME